LTNPVYGVIKRDAELLLMWVSFCELNHVFSNVLVGLSTVSCH